MASSVSEDFRDELTCPICVSVYERPLRLPCGHSYCHSCVVNMVKPTPVREARYPGERQLPCPECRQVYPIPIQGVDAVFRPDFKLARLVEVLDRVERRVTQQTQEVHPCLQDLTEPCDSSEPPVSLYDNVGETTLHQHSQEPSAPFPVGSEDRTSPPVRGDGHHGNGSASGEGRDGTGRKVASNVATERHTLDTRVLQHRMETMTWEASGAGAGLVSGALKKDGHGKCPPPVHQTPRNVGVVEQNAGVYVSPHSGGMQRSHLEAERQLGPRDSEAATSRRGGGTQISSVPCPNPKLLLKGDNSTLLDIQGRLPTGATTISSTGVQVSVGEECTSGGSRGQAADDLSLPSDPAISGFSAFSSEEDTLVPEDVLVVGHSASSAPDGSTTNSVAQDGRSDSGSHDVPRSSAAVVAERAEMQSGTVTSDRTGRASPSDHQAQSSSTRTHLATSQSASSSRDLHIQSSQSASSSRDLLVQSSQSASSSRDTLVQSSQSEDSNLELQGAVANRSESGSGAEAASSAEGSSTGSVRLPKNRQPGTRAEDSQSRSSRSSKLGFGMKLKKFFSSLLSLDSSSDEDDEVPQSSLSNSARMQRQNSSSSQSSYDNGNKSSTSEEETRRKYLYSESDSD